MNDLITTIHGDATSDQIAAIDHIGSHARLLAGPGTGKTQTLTHRVLSLILQYNVDPDCDYCSYVAAVKEMDK